MLIALALPLQGAAAATMLPALASPATSGMAQHAHHGQHCAHDGAMSGKAGSSACAVCCIGAALAASAPTVHPPRSVATVRTRPNDGASPGITPAVLERPPRTFLA
jgi:hypothetical protein